MEKAGRGELDGSRVLLAGRSLGGAVAVAAAARLLSDSSGAWGGARERAGGSEAGMGVPERAAFAPCGLVVENSFTSISAMVDAKFPFLNIPFFKNFFLRLHWDSLAAIRGLSLPILFLSSAKDEIVPREQMIALHSAATAAAARRFHVFKDTTHNDIWSKGGYAYWDAKRAFVQEFAKT